jgi:hypothetical protein
VTLGAATAVSHDRAIDGHSDSNSGLINFRVHQNSFDQACSGRHPRVVVNSEVDQGAERPTCGRSAVPTKQSVTPAPEAPADAPLICTCQDWLLHFTKDQPG